MSRLARRNRPSARVAAESEPAIRRCHISQEAPPCRATRCKGSKYRDRETKWCTSANMWGSAIFLRGRAKRLRSGNPFSKSFDIRGDKELHRRVFRDDRTCATTVFRRGRWRPKWRHLRFSTSLPRPRAHRGGEYLEDCSAESSEVNGVR